ncbi:hypothetical protein SAMCCGM7_pC0920 (plasmid) [Sinorhizobium americanum CCGM7]|nr:hypothetical protein SAMCCGM7_pC0920 [Sinorhizobium americanum CCGM7]
MGVAVNMRCLGKGVRAISGLVSGEPSRFFRGQQSSMLDL